MAATDPLSLGIAGAAAVVAALAAWFQRPRAPQLDAERWFKTTLVTLLRGHVEAQGGSAEAWLDAVAAWVPWHPAGRLPERKIDTPSAFTLPGPALPGEVDLLEALAHCETATARWARLFDEDPLARELLTADPVDLGPDYSPTAALGPAVSWDTVAAWGAQESDLGAKIHERLGALWVLLEGRTSDPGPDLLPHLAKLLPSAHRVPWSAERTAEQLADTLAELVQEESSRLILVSQGAASLATLKALQSHAPLRDHVSAVLSLGGVIGGLLEDSPELAPARCKDWLERWFGQEHLDTEVVRLTPYISLQWLDRAVWPPGVARLPLQNARYPEPAAQQATATTIESVDLGVLPAQGMPLALIAKAVMFLTAGWLASRQ